MEPGHVANQNVTASEHRAQLIALDDKMVLNSLVKFRLVQLMKNFVMSEHHKIKVK